MSSTSTATSAPTASSIPTPEKPRPEDLLLIKIVHRAMRTDAAAFATAIEQLPGSGGSAVAQLAGWWRRFEAAIVVHHTIEDELIWPALIAEDPSYEEAAEQLTRDHHALDAAMTSVRESLSALQQAIDSPTARTQALEAVDGFCAVLFEHLDREEAVAFPSILTTLTAAQWHDLTERARKRGTVQTLSFEVPWIIDHSSPDEAVALFADAPGIFRFVHRMLWRRRYERRAALVRSSRGPGDTRSRRTRLAVPAVLALAAALVLSTSACGSDGDAQTAAAGGALAAHVDRLPSTLELEATDYTFTSETSAVAAGPVTVRLTNNGREAHQVQIGRITGDLTPEEFVRVFHEQGEPAAFDLLEWVGGVNGTEPGETQQATTVFEAGNYLMVCFIPDEQGQSHVLHQMVVPLQVAGDSDATVPVADDVITLTDYAVGLPTGFTGKGVYEVRNEGQELHELILFRLHDDKTIADLTTWAAAGMKGPTPYDTTGGAATIGSGTSSWVTLDLRPGNYVALCVITSPATMQQHVQMGMATPFVVT